VPEGRKVADDVTVRIEGLEDLPEKLAEIGIEMEEGALGGRMGRAELARRFERRLAEQIKGRRR